MKQLLLLPILILLFLIPASAQSDSQNNASNPTARKFDEFDFSDWKREQVARFAEVLTKEPKAKGYIIAYQERVSGFCGEVSVGGMLWFIRNSLEGRLDFPVNPERIVEVRGGFREKQMVEFFIVPEGANPPVAKPTVKPVEAVRCPCLGYTGASSYAFENSNSPLGFYTSFRNDDSKEKPIIKWSVSEGRILSGQGTTSIVVERPSLGYRSITATVEIEGFSSECKLKRSASSPEQLSSLPIKIDEFGSISCDDEMARTDHLAIGLQADPIAQGYIIAYGGKVGKHNEAKARLAWMKAYLVQNRGISSERVITIDGGFRETRQAELWLIEKGKDAPIPSPTVNKKDVKLKGWARIVNEPCM